jgi:hypothetical protein
MRAAELWMSQTDKFNHRLMATAASLVYSLACPTIVQRCEALALGGNPG